MRFDIESDAGARPLLFGMTVREIRSLMPVQPKPFQKGLSRGHPTDAFRGLGVHVYYDNSGRCEAIEFASPAIVAFRGVSLISVAFATVEALVGAHDAHVEVDENGLISKTLGFAIDCPGHVEEPSLPVSGVFVFKHGYYAVVDPEAPSPEV